MPRLPSLLVITLLCFFGSASATAGFAEWVVITPGGNAIRHSDGFKEEHGDCITSDPDDDKLSLTGRELVWVSYLKRWRYYEDFIAGENKTGFFLFQESTKTIRTFDSEPALDTAIAEAKLAPAISEWLNGGDAYTESWFPFFTWSPCQLLTGKRKPANEREVKMLEMLRARPKATGADCTDLTKLYPLYRRTTWGKQCRQLRDEVLPRAKSPEDEMYRAFCEDLLGEKVELRYRSSSSMK